MATEVHQRVAAHHSDDEDYGSEVDSDSDYGADQEDNADEVDEDNRRRDPGPFLHNKKVAITALPCFLLLLSLVGEILVIIISIGTAVIITLDHKGEKKRSLVVLTLLFVPCHILVIYSIFPLLWITVYHFFLLGAINIYFLLTGGWLLLQFTLIRREERPLCQLIERLLFTLYPAVCVVLLTWTLSTVVMWYFTPLVFLAIGFIVLQIYMLPAKASFAVATSEDEDLSVMNQPMVGMVTVCFLVLPLIFQIILDFIHLGTGVFLDYGAITHQILIASLSIFLTSLLSIRQFFEYKGWPYHIVIYARWTSGSVATGFCYLVLLNYGMASHFLPWLPLGITVYAVYGALVNNKKWKGAAIACLGTALVLFAVWMYKLPWRIVYDILYGLPIVVVYVLIFINAVLCLGGVYIAPHGRQEFLDLLICLQTVGFTVCEVLLFDVGLYQQSLYIVTGIAAVYTLQRLYLANKLSLNHACFCISVHVTKAVLALLYLFLDLRGELNFLQCLQVFLQFLVLIRVVVNESRSDLSKNESLSRCGLLIFTTMLNARMFMYIVCVILLKEQPTGSDMLGMSLVVSGSLVVLMALLHMPTDDNIKRLGFATIFVGVLILVLQPDLSLTWFCLFQWGEVVSIMLAVLILLDNRPVTFRQVSVLSVMMGICPGVRAALMLYWTEELGGPVFQGLLCVLITLCLICVVLCFCKAQHLSHGLERHVLLLFSCLALLSVSLLIADGIYYFRSYNFLALPAWRVCLCASLILSICLKILASLKGPEIIPLTHKKEENKNLPLLPLLANISTILSFGLGCLLSPGTGFLHDTWCCAWTLILVCLQKDRRLLYNLKQQNQVVPTMLTALAVLVTATILRSDLWTSGSWTFVRSLMEVSSVLGTLPVHYMLWGYLWKETLVLSEQLVIFLFPLNCVMWVYASTYTSWVTASCGLFSGIWMVVFKLPLMPYQTSHSHS